MQRLLKSGGSVWDLVKPASGLVVLALLALVGVSLLMGLIGAVVSFLGWIAVRVLPIIAVAALIYWLARETGLLARFRK